MSKGNDASHLAMKPCPGCGVMVLGLKDAAPGHCGPCREKPACVLCGSRESLATRCGLCDEKMLAGERSRALDEARAEWEKPEQAGFVSGLREIDQTVLMAHLAEDQDLDFTRGWNAALSHIAVAIKRKLDRETQSDE